MLSTDTNGSTSTDHHLQHYTASSDIELVLLLKQAERQGRRLSRVHKPCDDRTISSDMPSPPE